MINRSSIEGPKLRIAVLPNTETPCAIKVDYNNTSSVEAGAKWPGKISYSDHTVAGKWEYFNTDHIIQF